MQIWLGKQYLGQRDNLDQRVNTEVQIRADYSKRDDAELAELERLTNKACAQTIDVTPVALLAAPDAQVGTGEQTQECVDDETVESWAYPCEIQLRYRPESQRAP